MEQNTATSTLVPPLASSSIRAEFEDIRRKRRRQGVERCVRRCRDDHDGVLHSRACQRVQERGRQSLRAARFMNDGG